MKHQKNLKIQYASLSSKDVKEKVEEKVGVINENGEAIKYEESMCHPSFVSKHSSIAKIAGGAAHVLMLGIPFFTGLGQWPGFTNSEEACIVCKRSPGVAGCLPVRRKVAIRDANDKEEVDHTNQL